MNLLSHAMPEPARRCARWGRKPTAFTLVELMVAVGIMAVILTIAIPSIYRVLHPDSMAKAVNDVMDACRQARSHAIMNGVTVALKIQPRERTLQVMTAPVRSDPQAATDPSVFRFEGAEMVRDEPTGSAVFTAKLSDKIFFEFLGVNLIPDLQEFDEVSCLFYPNGTSDEMAMVLRSEANEWRKITTEVVTGSADYEVVR